MAWSEWKKFGGGFEIEEEFSQVGSISYYATSATATASASVTVPKGKYLVESSYSRCTARHTDKIVQMNSGNVKPTFSSETATLLSETDNYIIVESDNDIVFNGAFSGSGFANGLLSLSVLINAYKIK